MKNRKMKLIIIATFIILLAVLLYYVKYNKIIGIIHGADREEIVINDISYIMFYPKNVSYSVKGAYYGAAGFEEGEKAFYRLYRIKGDSDLKYLYAVWQWERFFYIREDLVGEIPAIEELGTAAR